MNQPVILYLTLLSLTVSGCVKPPAVMDPPPVDTGPETTPAPAAPDDDSYVVSFKLATVFIPGGMASNSEDIWSYLNEEPLGPSTIAILARNGVRLGVGRNQNWPELVRVLQKMTGQQVQASYMPAFPGKPMSIRLKTDQPAQTIFLSHPDLSLSGEDYPPGTNILKVCCTVDPEDRDRVLVTAMPLIETSHRTLRIVEEKGSRTALPLPDLLSFPELAFQVSISRKEFLVIGPGAESRRPTSLGSRFLSRQRDGMPFETVLILMPRVIPAREAMVPSTME